MSGVKTATGVGFVIALLLGALWLERIPRGRPLELKDVEVAAGEGFSIPLPDRYLLIVDQRFAIPPGAVALGREGEGGDRATIMVAPYPASGDELLTFSGCETVAKVHAKQVGAQLVSAELGGMRNERSCQAKLSEGHGVVGRMILRRQGSSFLMVTCRFDEKIPSDAKACDQVLAALAR